MIPFVIITGLSVIATGIFFMQYEIRKIIDEYFEYSAEEENKDEI